MNDNQQITAKESGSVNLGRHKSQCSICLHPNCKEIEEYWIDWGHISHIENVYGVSRDAMYRHAHALDLSGKRRKNITRALERIIEKVEATSPSASAVVSAVKAYVKLNSSGQGTEQAQGTDPKKLLERMSQVERDAFARDGSLPEWFSSATNATPGDGQEGEKASQITEAKRLQ
jgi:hypothetical protein